jgi:hypothetical protein
MSNNNKNLPVPGALFGDEDLMSPRAIREYLNRIRRISRMGSQELEDGAEQIFGVLEKAPGMAVLMGWDSRRMAGRIVEPLRHAVGAYDAAARLSVLTWQRFNKEFGPVIEAEQKNKGKSGKKMDWTDA